MTLKTSRALLACFLSLSLPLLLACDPDSLELDPEPVQDPAPPHEDEFPDCQGPLPSPSVTLFVGNGVSEEDLGLRVKFGLLMQTDFDVFGDSIDACRIDGGIFYSLPPSSEPLEIELLWSPGYDVKVVSPSGLEILNREGELPLLLPPLSELGQAEPVILEISVAP